MVEIKLGTVITAKHIATGKILTYMVVRERFKNNRIYYRVLNLKSHFIMVDFKTTEAIDVIDYIKSLGNGCEIVGISNHKGE